MSQTTKKVWKQKLIKTTNLIVNITLVVYMSSASVLFLAPERAVAVSVEATITAYKVVCDDESKLPDWGDGGSAITSSTAQIWADTHEGCELVDDWEFEWGFDGQVSDAGDTLIGTAGGNWTTFGSSTTINVGAGATVWFREVLQAGYVPFHGGNTGDANGEAISAEFYCDEDVLNYDNYDYINAVSGGEYYCVGFNVAVPTYSIHGYKFNDLNINGKDNDDPKLPGWTIKLYKESDLENPIDTMVTSSDPQHLGWYWFENLERGTYHICEVGQPGWNQTSPEADACHWVTLPYDNEGTCTEELEENFVGDVPIMCNFGNIHPGRIAGYKYDSSDTPLPGWEICLDVLESVQPPEGDFVANVVGLLPEDNCETTNENGYYEFTGLKFGDYMVTETMQEGWAALSPVDGHMVNIQSNTGFEEEPTMYNFINYQTAEPIVEPVLALDKTDSADPVMEAETFRYTLDWELTEGYAIHLTLTDPLPAEVTYIDSDGGTYDAATHTVTWDLGFREAVASGSVWIDVEVNSGIDDATVLINEATLSTEYDVVENGVEADFTMAATRQMYVVATAEEETTILALPSLGILKTTGTTLTNPGKTVDYTVTVSNSGKGQAENVTVTDTLPAGLYFYENGANTGERVKMFDIGTLAAGDDHSINYTVYVDSNLGEGEYDNVAITKADNHDDVSDDAKIDVRVPTVLGEEAGSELAIEKTVDKELVNPGGTANYTVTVTSVGEAPALNVKLVDILPEGFTFTESGSYTHSWELGDLVPGEVKDVTYEVKVDASMQNGKYINLAVASADDVNDVNDKVSLEVRAGQVLGAEDDLTETGATMMDWLLAAFALMLIAGGITIYSFAHKRA
ncbi:MAG: hypothetical protein ABIB97_02875 [Patescibacteria group bacterium]